MITLGFKNKFSGMLRAVAAIVLGLIMIIMPGTALVLVVKVLAAFLIAAGVVTLIYGVVQRERGALSLTFTNTVVDILIGVLLFIYPQVVAGFIVSLMGVVLLCMGILQIVVLASSARVGGISPMLFLLPVLCTLGGILLLFNPFKSAETFTLIAGLFVLIYGVSEAIATWRMNRVIKSYKREYDEKGFVSPIESEDDVVNVDYEKVDEQ